MISLVLLLGTIARLTRSVGLSLRLSAIALGSMLDGIFRSSSCCQGVSGASYACISENFKCLALTAAL